MRLGGFGEVSLRPLRYVGRAFFGNVSSRIIFLSEPETARICQEKGNLGQLPVSLVEAHAFRRGQ